MVKRNIASILIIISSLITLLNQSFDNLKAGHYVMITASLLIIVASVFLIYNTEKKNKEQ